MPRVAGRAQSEQCAAIAEVGSQADFSRLFFGKSQPREVGGQRLAGELAFHSKFLPR